MARVVSASNAEPGCRTYSYAEEVNEPGLFRVYEEWESREVIEAPFQAPHMREWQAVREPLGFHGRSVVAYETGEPTAF